MENINRLLSNGVRLITPTPQNARNFEFKLQCSKTVKALEAATTAQADVTVQRALTDLTNTSVVAGTFIGEECPASSSEFFGTLGAAAIAAGHDRNVLTDASAPVQTFSTTRSSSGNVYNFVFLT